MGGIPTKCFTVLVTRMGPNSSTTSSHAHRCSWNQPMGEQQSGHVIPVSQSDCSRVAVNGFELTNGNKVIQSSRLLLLFSMQTIRILVNQAFSLHCLFERATSSTNGYGWHVLQLIEQICAITCRKICVTSNKRIPLYMQVILLFIQISNTPNACFCYFTCSLYT